MPPNVERRLIERPVELRAAPDGATGPGILHGYGAVFNSESRDLGGFREVIRPGAFGEAIEGNVDMTVHGRVIARTNHDSNLLLGTTDAGTLRLYLDEVGLRYEVDLPDTTYARDLAVLAARGDYRFSSFAFRTPPGGDEWGYDASDQLVRYVTSATLADVAPVADPAYWDASTELARSFDLDAVRASLTPPAPARARGDWAAVIRHKDLSNTIERDYL